MARTIGSVRVFRIPSGEPAGGTADNQIFLMAWLSDSIEGPHIPAEADSRKDADKAAGKADEAARRELEAGRACVVCRGGVAVHWNSRVQNNS